MDMQSNCTRVIVVFVTSSGDSHYQSISGISGSTVKKDDVSGLERNGSSSECFVDSIVTLDENDVPGTSLNGKIPSQLNVMQLKRWLACRGTPQTGKKPELIEW